MQMAKSGGNPQQMMQQMINQNPQMQQMLRGVDTNNPQAMEQLCKNVCLQKGIDFDTAMAQFKRYR